MFKLSFKNTLALLIMSFSSASFAVDSASFEIGTGNKTQIVRVGAQWDWQRQWWQGNGTHLGGYWDLTAARWHGTRFQNIPGANQNISDIGITPVLRFQQDGKVGAYFEAGIGAHVLSDLYDNNGRRLSTKFEFGDHLAIGYQFSQGVSAGLKLQHFSNGGIRHPNNGVNLVMASISQRF